MLPSAAEVTWVALVCRWRFRWRLRWRALLPHRQLSDAAPWGLTCPSPPPFARSAVPPAQLERLFNHNSGEGKVVWVLDMKGFGVRDLSPAQVPLPPPALLLPPRQPPSPRQSPPSFLAYALVWTSVGGLCLIATNRTLVLLFFSLLQLSSPQGANAMPMFANHYPERMGQIVVLDPPALFQGLWLSIQPILDPVTKSKVVQ